MRILRIELPLVAALMISAAWSFANLEAARPAKLVVQGQLDEVLYLPRGQALRFISFGYRHALANLLWFNTINYFGKHYASDQSYRWLAHMCDIVTTLDPEAKHVYEFGSTMLAWEENQPEQAIALLDKAIANNPRHWRFPYLRGFVHMFFLKDYRKATDDFLKASKLPGAHYITAQLAARKLSGLDQPEAAVSFLTDMLKTTSDPAARSALELRLKDAIYETQMRLLERAVDAYRQREGRDPASLQELVDAGLISGIPRDPHGGDYFFDPAERVVKNSSGRKRLKIYGHHNTPESKQ